MPIVDYSQYLMGFVPASDVAAQTRCYKYLKETIEILDRAIAQNHTQTLVNLRTIFLDIKSMVEISSGSRRLSRANNFWRYWDKNKLRIFEVHDDSKDSYAFQNTIAELEEGRYIQA